MCILLGSTSKTATLFFMDLTFGLNQNFVIGHTTKIERMWCVARFGTMKNIHIEVLLLLKFNFIKSNTPPWVFSRFFNCVNGAKLRNASHHAYKALSILCFSWMASVISEWYFSENVRGAGKKQISDSNVVTRVVPPFLPFLQGGGGGLKSFRCWQKGGNLHFLNLQGGSEFFFQGRGRGFSESNFQLLIKYHIR